MNRDLLVRDCVRIDDLTVFDSNIWNFVVDFNSENALDRVLAMKQTGINNKVGRFILYSKM